MDVNSVPQLFNPPRGHCDSRVRGAKACGGSAQWIGVYTCWCKNVVHPKHYKLLIYKRFDCIGVSVSVCVSDLVESVLERRESACDVQWVARGLGGEIPRRQLLWATLRNPDCSCQLKRGALNVIASALIAPQQHERFPTHTHTPLSVLPFSSTVRTFAEQPAPTQTHRITLCWFNGAVYTRGIYSGPDTYVQLLPKCKRCCVLLFCGN